MSEATSPRRILHLVVDGFPPEQLAEINPPASGTDGVAEIFELNESNAAEALEKIFTADTVAVWGKVERATAR